MATETEPSPLTLPPVAKALFQFLPAKTLCIAARVCKLWASLAERCLQQRTQYGWQFFEDDYENRTQTVMEKIEHYFEEIAFRPSTVLVFMTSDLWEHIGRVRPGQKRKLGDQGSRTAWKSFCRKTIPSPCEVFCTVSDGIVGTITDLSCTTEKEQGRGATVLCFGQYPGLKVSLGKSRGKPHCFFNKTVKSRSRSSSSSSQFTLEDAKMVLLMSCFPGSQSTVKVCRTQLPHALLVGGVVSTTCVHGIQGSVADCSNDSRNSMYPYCVFFQGKDIQVACVKLGQSDNEVDKVEKILKKLKDRTKEFPMERSIAFMYACVARGLSLYNKRDVEASLFRKHFPNTPLFGIFGNGEIGFDFPPADDAVLNPTDMHHAYTTFLAVVSLP